MGATGDLIVRTQNRAESSERSQAALRLPPTSLCNGTYSPLPTEACCRRSWARLVCGSYSLPWGKNNFPRVVLSHGSSRFSLLLLWSPHNPGLQNSAQALPPTEIPFALLLHTLSLNMGAADILHGLKPTLPWLSCLQAFANSGLLLEEAMMRPLGRASSRDYQSKTALFNSGHIHLVPKWVNNDAACQKTLLQD